MAHPRAKTITGHYGKEFERRSTSDERRRNVKSKSKLISSTLRWWRQLNIRDLTITLQCSKLSGQQRLWLRLGPRLRLRLRVRLRRSQSQSAPPNVNDFETDDGALAKISSGQDKDRTVDLAKKKKQKNKKKLKTKELKQPLFSLALFLFPCSSRIFHRGQKGGNRNRLWPSFLFFHLISENFLLDFIVANLPINKRSIKYAYPAAIRDSGFGIREALRLLYWSQSQNVNKCSWPESEIRLTVSLWFWDGNWELGDEETWRPTHKWFPETGQVQANCRCGSRFQSGVIILIGNASSGRLSLICPDDWRL